MVKLALLGRVPLFQGMPRWALTRLAEVAVDQQLPAGQVLVNQYDRARDVFFLVAGTVEILIRVGGEDLLVATLGEPGEPIGWSAFRPPYRYTSTTRCQGPCHVIRVPAGVFDELVGRDPALAYRTLQKVAASLANRLDHTREALSTPPRRGPVGEGARP